MNKYTDEMESIKRRDHELQTLVELSDKTELGQCVRLISVYLALYKNSFGELPAEQVEKMLSLETIDGDTAKVFDNGIREAIAILAMVLQSQELNQNKTIN